MKPAIICIIATLLMVGLLAFFYNSRHEPVPETYWKDTSIACLPNGHANLAMHIHTTLEIVVDGNEESVPAGIGVANDCLAEVHTHEADNVIHIETSKPDEQFTLGDFYRVWGQDLNRPDLELEIFVDDEKIEGIPDTIILKDAQKIRLQYTSNG